MATQMGSLGFGGQGILPGANAEALAARQYATGTAATRDQIGQLYRDVFGRDADAEGLDFYAASGWSPEQIRAQLAKSPEAAGMQARQLATGTAANSGQINQVYRDAFGRDADKEGMQFYSSAGWSPEQIKAELMKSPERQAMQAPPNAVAAGALQPTQSQAPSGANLGFTPSLMGGFNLSAPAMKETYQPNPYMADMSKAITSQVNDNLMRNVLPGIGSSAIAAGGYGGSRQGVIEANALKDANQGLSSSLAGMYYGDYNNAMNRNLQRYTADQSFNLGLGGLMNSANSSLQNFYTNQRQLDYTGMNTGLNMLQAGQAGLANQGTGLYNAGLNQFNAGVLPYQTAASMYQPFTGLNNTASTVTPGPNWLQGAAAGGLAGMQFGRLWGG